MAIKRIQKILIANRGEIACRVIKTCKKLGIKTVAVFSDADKNGLFVSLADEAVHIGPSSTNESYLCIEKIINAALQTKSDAIHPAYGFLSESADFARACSENKIIFIGPKPESILSIGDKIGAKNLLASSGVSVPLIPGYNGNDQSIDRLINEAIKIGFPVLLKASAGGGGKGMRVVREKSKLKEEIEMAKSEAIRYFGDDKILIEKFFENIKHIEIQIIGDQHGNVYHCFERECSVQRRHQKVIEEAPAFIMTEELRRKMTTSAIEIGKLIQYEGAGTVEFIVDPVNLKYYFLEVNTRLQVEHPITEAITNLDLVELQIMVASGYSLKGFGLENLKFKGHAIESRLYAENPNKNFFPSVGQVLFWHQPHVPGSSYPRYDTGVTTGSVISVFYDPMISKITVWAPTREEAIQKMKSCLLDTACLGLITNKSFLLQCLNEKQFLNGSYTTKLVDLMTNLGFDYQLLVQPTLKKIKTTEKEEILELTAQAPHQKIQLSDSPFVDLSLKNEIGIVSTVWLYLKRFLENKHWNSIPNAWSFLPWRPKRESFRLNGDSKEQDQIINIEYLPIGDRFSGKKEMILAMRPVELEDIGGKHSRVEIVKSALPWLTVQLVDFEILPETPSFCVQLRLSIGGILKTFIIAKSSEIHHYDSLDFFVHNNNWPRQFYMSRLDPLRAKASFVDDPLSAYQSTMPCRILKFLAQNNSKVKVGDPLLTIESMKMETRIYSKHEGIVKFKVQEGDIIEAGVSLLIIE